MSYLCPLCQKALLINQNTYRCLHNHQFDVAKEGYVNLLPVQHKRSKDPGDNKAMMQARLQFLNAGHYQPMRDALGEIVTTLLMKIPNPQLLDIGCGEGYYTHHFFNALTNANVYGLDISKIMIRSAAKRYPQCDFVVASSQRLPFSDTQFDAIVRIFAPCHGQELDRVTKDGGIMVTVTPGARHLYQLKAHIYDNVHLHDIPEEIIPSFTLESEHNVTFPMVLRGDEACLLLQMTPFAWRAPQSLWEQLKNTAQFNCEADFTLRVYRKRAKKDLNPFITDIPQ